MSGLGGSSGRIFEYRSCTVGTQTCTEHFTHVYSDSSFALSFSGRAGIPFGQVSPCLLLGTYFFSFCQSCGLSPVPTLNSEALPRDHLS